MITLKDMKKAVITTLQKEFTYPCYEFGVVEGMKNPCFFVRVTESGEINTKNTYHHNYSVEIAVMYGKKESGNESKVLEDVEKIKQMFLATMQTEKRVVPVSDFEIRYTGERGNVPQITFDSEFLDSIYKPEEAEMMKQVNIKEVLQHGDASD